MATPAMVESVMALEASASPVRKRPATRKAVTPVGQAEAMTATLAGIGGRPTSLTQDDDQRRHDEELQDRQHEARADIAADAVFAEAHAHGEEGERARDVGEAVDEVAGQAGERKAEEAARRRRRRGR